MARSHLLSPFVFLVIISQHLSHLPGWLPKIRTADPSHLGCKVLWERVIFRITTLMARCRGTHPATPNVFLFWKEIQADRKAHFLSPFTVIHVFVIVHKIGNARLDREETTDNPNFSWFRRIVDCVHGRVMLITYTHEYSKSTAQKNSDIQTTSYNSDSDRQQWLPTYRHSCP